MAKQFPTTDHKAVAYAAMKELARILKSDGELPPGYQQDVSGKRCVVTIPQGTTVHRPEGGEDGAPIGKQYKAAMQNTYGYSVLYLLVERLERFCQHEVVLAELTAAICEIVENNADTTENTLRQRNPDLYEDSNRS